MIYLLKNSVRHLISMFVPCEKKNLASVERCMRILRKLKL